MPLLPTGRLDDTADARVKPARLLQSTLMMTTQRRVEAMLQSAQLQLTTPACDAATDVIAVGPCRLRCMKNEHWMLCKMQEEIERRFRVPVSLEQLLEKYEHTRCDAGRKRTMQGKSWSHCIWAISRCMAAFQKATDATEHSECRCIATKTCDYAIALARNTPAYSGHEDLLALVHQFMQNRVYNLAFIHLLDRAICSREHEDDDSFWSLVRDVAHPSFWKKECLRTIEVCMDAIRNHANHLQSQMDVYRP